MSAERNRHLTNRQLKFLSISQSETPGDSSLPETTKEVDEVVEVICSMGWFRENIFSLQGSEATVDGVSSALYSCSCIHFVCHGHQDSIMGMKSAFSSYNGCLELTKIASKRLSAGQFALLSACHAASGLKLTLEALMSTFPWNPSSALCSLSQSSYTDPKYPSSLLSFGQ